MSSHGRVLWRIDPAHNPLMGLDKPLKGSIPRGDASIGTTTEYPPAVPAIEPGGRFAIPQSLRQAAMKEPWGWANQWGQATRVRRMPQGPDRDELIPVTTMDEWVWS